MTGDQRRARPHRSRPQHRRHSATPAEVQIPIPCRSGRMLAWAVLQLAETSDRFLQDLLADFDAQTDLSGAERALAVDLSSGVMKRRRTLDHLILSQLQRPRSQTEPGLWQILRIGTFQLLAGRIPPHAAVHTAVELCRELGQSRWTGFVNGMLRSILRLFSEEETEGPSAAAVPAVGGRWIRLTEPIFADPAAETALWFGQSFSLPSFTAERWAARFSSAELIRIGFASCDAPVNSVRVNLLRAWRNDILQSFHDAGIEAVAGNLPCSIRLQKTLRPDALPGFREGLWSIQDESAMAAAELLAPLPGERILDLCAAPGGKTAHLAELSGDRAQIVACDISEYRLHRIRQNAERLQLQGITTQLISPYGENIPEGPFDAVLIDVPCSNSGVLGRRPEARWRLDADSLQELIRIQTRLLLQAVDRVRPGGRIVYSTCSLEPEENEELIRGLMPVLKQWQMSLPRMHLPGSPADGACQILLTKNN